MARKRPPRGSPWARPPPGRRPPRCPSPAPPIRTTGAVTGPTTEPSAPTVTAASSRTSPSISPSIRSSVEPVTSPRRRVPGATWVTRRFWAPLEDSEEPPEAAGADVGFSRRKRAIATLTSSVDFILKGGRRLAPVAARIGRIGWSGQRDSNPRHQAWEACTLPTELCPLGGSCGKKSNGEAQPGQGGVESRSRTLSRPRRGR